MALKLLLVGISGTIVNLEGKVNRQIMTELAALTRKLSERGVRVALWSNRSWTLGDRGLSEVLSEMASVPVAAHGASEDGTPARRLSNSVVPLLNHYGVEKHETILVGASDDDMRAGVNNGLLYIRADWYGQISDYGFSVKSVSELARFCFVFALRQHLLFFSLKNGGLDYHAAGPFSTMKEAYAMFGEDARDAAKFGQGHPDFWFLLTISTLYFSGLLSDVKYICTYPGHDASTSQRGASGLAVALTRLGRCFQKSFYDDLIVRHSTAIKSQSQRAARRRFLNQLSTIHLNRYPHRNLSDSPRRTPIRLSGQTVLVVDDFCTSGRSLEAARAYIEAAGGRARLFTWLKTINTSYCQIANAPVLSPYEPNEIDEESPAVPYAYEEHIVDQEAACELAEVFGLYSAWSFP